MTLVVSSPVGWLLNPLLARFTQYTMIPIIISPPMIPKTRPRMRPNLEEEPQPALPHQS
jgi:hypothetical protein